MIPGIAFPDTRNGVSGDTELVTDFRSRSYPFQCSYDRDIDLSKFRTAML